MITNNNFKIQLEDIETQEDVLNASYERLMAQGRSCVDSRDQCVYYRKDSLSPQGRQGCAIGIILTREQAKKWHEEGSFYMTAGGAIDGLKGDGEGDNKVNLDGFKPPWVCEENKEFLNDLQLAHDTTNQHNSTEGWRNELTSEFNQLAEKYSLILEVSL